MGTRKQKFLQENLQSKGNKALKRKQTNTHQKEEKKKRKKLKPKQKPVENELFLFIYEAVLHCFQIRLPYYILYFYKSAYLIYLDKLQTTFILNHKAGYSTKGLHSTWIINMTLGATFFLYFQSSLCSYVQRSF